MTNGLYTTAVGLVPQMYKQDVISNNLANINTTGYKKDGVLFRRLLDENLFQQLYDSEFEFMPEVQDTQVDFQQGPFIQTQNTFDIAIEGDGFFVVETPDGLAYTRNGNFTIDADRQLVTNAGLPVLGEDGFIEIDENARSIQISEQGEIFINKVRTNKFSIRTFDDTLSLMKTSNGLFVPKDNTVRDIPVEDVKIKQGYLEGSNVNAVEEMVSMLNTLRQFEAMQKSIKNHSDTMQKSVNELGRIT